MRACRPLSTLPALGLVLAAGLWLAGDARAQELRLAPRWQPGDAYTLSLHDTTETEASARRREALSERVELAYRADVEVLEVDAAGRPVREWHERVRLTAERPDGEATLFAGDASFEVRRDGRGGVRLFAVDGPVARGVERVVAPLLESHLAHGLVPALLDPGRPVGPGDRWEIPEAVARRLLRASDVRAVEVDGAPTATLRPDPDDPGLVSVHYRIPVARAEADAMPENLHTSRSSAVVEGRIDLAAAGPVAHESTLLFTMDGVVRKPGVAAPFPWSLERSERTVERLGRVRRVADHAASSTPPPAAPAP